MLVLCSDHLPITIEEADEPEWLAGIDPCSFAFTSPTATTASASITSAGSWSAFASPSLSVPLIEADRESSSIPISASDARGLGAACGW